MSQWLMQTKKIQYAACLVSLTYRIARLNGKVDKKRKFMADGRADQDRLLAITDDWSVKTINLTCREKDCGNL